VAWTEIMMWQDNMNREKCGVTSFVVLFRHSPGWIYKTIEIPRNNWFAASGSQMPLLLLQRAW
jgi:hypothetical protein